MLEPVPESWLLTNCVPTLVTMDSEKLPTPPQEKISTEPGSSSDSSISRKQLKSPHTISKCSLKSSEKTCCVNSGLRPLRSPQNKDRSENYELLLQETKRTLSSSDPLVHMLQEQLKKIENLYKQSLDDTQKLRFKYCVATQELNTVRTICDKYREDVDALLKESNESDASKEISKLQKEIENWKARYEELLTWARLDIKAEQKKAIEPKEAQPESMQTDEFKNCIATLTEQYTCVKLALQQQNQKLELLVGKLNRDGEHFEEGELLKSLRLENNNLKQHLENLKTENERLVQLEQAKDFIVEENPSRLLVDQMLDDIQDNKQIQHLRDEVKNLQAETQKLYEQNFQLQLVIDQSSKQNKDVNQNETSENGQHEIKALKHEIQLLTEKNAELQSERNELIKITEQNGRFIQEQIQNLPDVPSGSIKDDDTVSNQENYKANKSTLFIEIDSYPSSPKTSNDSKQCSCDNNTADIETTSLKSSNSVKSQRSCKLSTKTLADFKECNCSNSAANKAGKSHQVGFVGGNLHLETELSELNKENSRLKMIIKDLKGNDRRSEQLEKFTVEVVTLRRQLKQAEEEIERLTQDSRSTGDRKNEIIENLRRQEELIKNDYDDLLKANALITSELKNKNAEMTEKEEIVESLYAKIKELETILNTNETLVKDALQEAAKVKDELDNKIKELDEKTTQYENLQGKTKELETAIDQNEQYNEVNNHRMCQDSIHKLQTELYISTQLAEDLNSDNENLRIQIDDMTKTLQQYKQEADFTKLENEKLRKKEEHMQYSVACSRNSNENLVKECGKELEKTQTLLSKITSEYKNFKLDCQTKLSQFDVENEQLKELLSARDDEINTLKDKLDTITKELHLVRSRHEKDLGVHERSLSEISVLFKYKEEELAATENKLQEQQEYLKTLEEENKTLKAILSKNTPASDGEETTPQKQIKELSILQQNYENEKGTTSELNTLLNNIRKEFQDLKLQLSEFLKKLESKLIQLKMETNDYNTSPTTSTLPKIVSEMLTDLARFSKGLQQSENSQNVKETERFSYFYEDIKSDGGKPDDNLKNVHTELESQFDCKLTDCKNVIKSSDEELFTNFMLKNEAAKNLELSIMTPAELVSKREYLVKKVKSIDQKLNVPATNSSISSASDISSPIKNTEKQISCGCKQSTEELIFKQKYYSNKIDLIDEKLKAFSNSSNANQICNSLPTENKSSLTSTYWEKNFQMIQQIASDVNELKMRLTAKSNNTKDISQTEASLQNSTDGNSLQLQVKNLQEQANATFLMSQQIHELEMQLETQQTKLKEYTIQRCADNLPNCNTPPPCSLFEKSEDEQIYVPEVEIMELPKTNLPQCPPKLPTHSCTKTDYKNAELEKTTHKSENEFQKNTTHCLKYTPEPVNVVPTPVPNLSKKPNCKCATSMLPKMIPKSDCGRYVKQSSKCCDQGRREIVLSRLCEKPPTGHANTSGLSSQTCECRKSSQCKKIGNSPRNVKLPCECLQHPFNAKCKAELKSAKNSTF